MLFRLIFIDVLLALSRGLFPIHYADGLAYRWDVFDMFRFVLLMSVWTWGLSRLHSGRRDFYNAYYGLVLGVWPPLRFLGLVVYLVQMMRWYRKDHGLSDVTRLVLILIQALVFSVLLW